MPFGSKGFSSQQTLLVERLVDRLWDWTRQADLPVVIDASSCLYAIKSASALLQGERQLQLHAFRVLDAAEFVRDTLLPRLCVHRLDRSVVLHPNCASRKLGTDRALMDVASRCAFRVSVPESLECCATAGDRSLLVPELTRSALGPEHAEVASEEWDGYYSNNLTCEMGLRQVMARPYKPFLYLVEEATRPA